MARHHSSKTQSGFILEPIETLHSNRVGSAFLIDLRRNARFDTNFPGEASAESGEQVYVTITNISLTGLRLEGSRQTIGALFANPDRRTPDTDSHISLEVHFSVPTDSDHLAPVKVHCKTVYTRRAEKDTYQIGMEFVTFEVGGRAALTQYFSYRGAAR